MVKEKENPYKTQLSFHTVMEKRLQLDPSDFHSKSVKLVKPKKQSKELEDDQFSLNSNENAPEGDNEKTIKIVNTQPAERIENENLGILVANAGVILMSVSSLFAKFVFVRNPELDSVLFYAMR